MFERRTREGSAGEIKPMSTQKFKKCTFPTVLAETQWFRLWTPWLTCSTHPRISGLTLSNTIQHMNNHTFKNYFVTLCVYWHWKERTLKCRNLSYEFSAGCWQMDILEMYNMNSYLISTKISKIDWWMIMSRVTHDVIIQTSPWGIVATANGIVVWWQRRRLTWLTLFFGALKSDWWRQ